MDSFSRSAAIGFATSRLLAAGPPTSNKVPEWALGDWTPVYVWQNTEMRFNLHPTTRNIGTRISTYRLLRPR